MTNENLIAAKDFCLYHNIEYTFITALTDAGLIHVIVREDSIFIPEDELQKLEKMMRLHHELEINIAGIEAIAGMLERMEGMQQEIISLKNQLKAYSS